MPRKTQIPAGRGAERNASETLGIETYRQDQAQAAQRKENKLDAFETELRQLIASTTDGLNELQFRCDSELTVIRRAQVKELQDLLQEKLTIENRIKQAADELSSAYNSMTVELQTAINGRMLDLADTRD